MNKSLKVLEEKLNGSISEKEFFRIIGDAVYDGRKHLKLSQDTLGELVGVTRVVINNIEKGTPTNNLYVLYKIFIILDIDLSKISTKIKRISKEVKPPMGPNEKDFYRLLKTTKLSEHLFEFLVYTINHFSGG